MSDQMQQTETGEIKIKLSHSNVVRWDFLPGIKFLSISLHFLDRKHRKNLGNRHTNEIKVETN